MIKPPLIALVASAALLSGCELRELLEDKTALRKEAEGKAVGAACRHAGRAIENCYANNAKVSKAAIFAGWREMDTYMRENNIQVVQPENGEDAASPDEEKKSADADGAKSETESAKKSADAKKPAAAPAGSTAEKRAGTTSA